MKEVNKLLFHPLERFSTDYLLVFGLIGLVIGGILGSFFSAHYDGVFDLHFASNVLWWEPFLENMLSALCLFSILYLTANFLFPVSIKKFLAFTLTARYPLYLLTFTNINNLNYETGQILFSNPIDLEKQIPMDSVILSVVFGALSIIALIWMLVLVFNGFKKVTRTKGIPLIIGFIIGIIVSELISRFIFLSLFQG